MSDLMLTGILRMPVTPQSDELTLTQYISCGRQAADLIEQQQQRIAELEHQLTQYRIDNLKIKAYNNELSTTIDRLRDVVIDYYAEDITNKEALDELWRIHFASTVRN